MEVRPPDPIERRRLEELSTAELVRHALQEAKLLARAEVVHARAELREEINAAKHAGVMLGTGGVLALCGLAALLVALGLALPLSATLGVLIAGAVALLIGGVLLLSGKKKLPKEPLPHTKERMRDDVTITKERFA